MHPPPSQPNEPESSEVLESLLERARRGERDAIDNLYSLHYPELRAIARRFMRRQRPHHTLRPTALLNEACLRLLRSGSNTWTDERHFLRAAAATMRHVLVDYQRRNLTGERVPEERVEVDRLLVVYQEVTGDVLAMNIAFERLRGSFPRGAEIVELHVFGGHEFAEIAALTGRSERQVFRDWKSARVLLRDYMERERTQ